MKKGHAPKALMPLSHQAADELQEAFDASDNDRDGRIHFVEFEFLLHHVGSQLTDAARAAEFRAIDKDGDGMIDRREFMEWCRQ